MRRRNYEIDAATRDVRSNHADFVQERDFGVLHAHKAAFHQQFEAFHNLQERQKTKEEKKLIEDCIKAVKTFVKSLGFKKTEKFVDIHEEDVHFYTSTELAEKFSGDDFTGFERMGNMYLKEEHDMRLLAATLTHEMAHTIAYGYLTYILERPVKEVGELTQEDFELLGIELIKGHSYVNENQTHFHGLHEAVTELIANRIRQIFFEDTSRFGMKEGKQLKHELSYGLHVGVLDHVLDRVETEEKPYEDIMQGIFVDHITGSDTFVDILSPKKLVETSEGTKKELIVGDAYWVHDGTIFRSLNPSPDAELLSDVLARMGRSDQSAYEVAQRIGAKEVTKLYEDRSIEHNSDEDLTT